MFTSGFVSSYGFLGVTRVGGGDEEGFAINPSRDFVISIDDEWCFEISFKEARKDASGEIGATHARDDDFGKFFVVSGELKAFALAESVTDLVGE